jgi:predicted nucleic acid-binding protein
MREIFGDTSGWANFVDPRQPFHALAVRSLLRPSSPAGTHSHDQLCVGRIGESAFKPATNASFPHRLGHQPIKASPIVEVVHIDPSLDAEAWDLFQRRPDKTWSLVDCASFVVMQKRGINEALTSDVHFEQAGFVRLLK